MFVRVCFCVLSICAGFVFVLVLRDNVSGGIEKERGVMEGSGLMGLSLFLFLHVVGGEGQRG